MIRIPPNVPRYLVDVLNELNAFLVRLQNPVQPMRVWAVADAANLPPAGQWRDGVVRVEDVGGSTLLAFSDGINWRRSDTLAVIA